MPPASSRSASGITGSRAPTTPPRRSSRNGPRRRRSKFTIDYIPSQGYKNLLTIAAEAQARSGHDILAMPTWWPQDHAKSLEPVDDIMEPLIKQNGAVNDTVKYLGRANDRWLAVPATIGSQIKGPCSRIDLMKQHAGIDVQALYPAGVAAEGGELDHGCLSQGRGSLPQGRRRRSASASARRRTRSTPRARSSSRSAPNWSTPRATSRSRPTRCARRSNTASRSRSSIRRTRRRGTTPPTTSGWCRARAR